MDERSVHRWVEQLFLSESVRITWRELRAARQAARIPRPVLRKVLRELEDAGVLECNRPPGDEDMWVWHRRATHRPATTPTANTVLLDHEELLDVLLEARRLTHPDVCRAQQANVVTAKINALVDRVRES